MVLFDLLEKTLDDNDNDDDDDDVDDRSNLNLLKCIRENSLIVFFFGSQDNVRNQLIQFELLLTTATFVVAIFGVVAGIFGMNFTVPIFDEPGAFKWVLIITGVCGFVVFFLFVWFFKYRRLMPL